jgi:hypothetical protein
MNICWVLAEHAVIPIALTAITLKSVAPIWSSWRNVRSFDVDNAVCYDIEQASKLIANDYHTVCNLYVSETVVQQHQNLPLKAFGGSFDFDIVSQDDIVGLHLASAQGQVVLLLGFDLGPKGSKPSDYLELIYQTINSYPQTQYVIIDQPGSVDKKLLTLANLTCDNLENVLTLLGGN